jgi:CRP-like cAMP-binding protein
LTSVALFDVEPSLLDCVPAADHDLALRVGHVRAIALPAGPWTPPAPDALGDEEPFAWLVADGALVATTRIAGREAARVLGPGDLFDPRSAGARLLSVEHTWRALRPTTLAALDGRYLAMARRWPKLTLTLQQRLCDEAMRAAILAAIGHLPRVEQRVLALLWHVADRFGRETPDGMAIDLELTHAELGRLVGARRPTVTLALQALREQGDLDRAADGAWLLAHQSRDALAV